MKSVDTKEFDTLVSRIEGAGAYYGRGTLVQAIEAVRALAPQETKMAMRLEVRLDKIRERFKAVLGGEWEREYVEQVRKNNPEAADTIEQSLAWRVPSPVKPEEEITHAEKIAPALSGAGKV